jgi:hypothetical protein
MNNHVKVGVIKSYFYSYLANTNFICFQELKLWGAKLQEIYNLM